MLVSTAITEILRVINNQNRSTEALIWLQETLREIQGVGRWEFCRSEKQHHWYRYQSFPQDFSELIDPMLLDTSTDVPAVYYLKTSDTTPTVTGYCPSGTTTVTVTVNSVDYAASVSGTAWTANVTNTLTEATYTVTATTDAGTVSTTKNQLVIDSTATTPVTSQWAPAATPWEDEDMNKLWAQRGDYRIDPYGSYIVLHDRWTAGTMLLRYYRKLTIPTATTETIDLPDEFVYRLSVYGASRHGLLGEDDYDRLQYAEAQFRNALREMTVKDGRDKVANAGKRLGGTSVNPLDAIYPFPSNYSVR